MATEALLNDTNSISTTYPELYKAVVNYEDTDSNPIGFVDLPRGANNALKHLTFPINSRLKAVGVWEENIIEPFLKLKTPKELLQHYLSVVKIFPEIGDCKYISGRNYNYMNYCKGGFDSKLQRLLDFTSDLVGFCKEKDPTLFTKSENMMLLGEIIYNVIRTYGLYQMVVKTQPLEDFKDKLNTIFGEERVFFKCNDSYGCGRAASYIPCTGNLSDPGYILIFSTTSSASMSQDITFLMSKIQEINETKCKKPSSSNTTTTNRENIVTGGRKKTKKQRKNRASQKKKTRKH